MNAKKFSAIITAFGVLFILMTASYAGAQNRRFQSPDQMLSNLKERLSLSEEQVTQIRPIVEEQIEKRRAIHEKYKDEGRSGRRSMRDEMQKTREDMETRLEAILSTEQMDAFRKLQDERRKNRSGKRGNRS